MGVDNRSKVNGRLNISANAIETIIKESIPEVEGVTGLAPLPLDLKGYILRADNPEKVKVSMNGGTLDVTFAINAKMGYSIKDISEKLQEQIKNTVQTMTGFIVSRVNIYVARLIMDEVE